MNITHNITDQEYQSYVVEIDNLRKKCRDLKTTNIRLEEEINFIKKGSNDNLMIIDKNKNIEYRVSKNSKLSEIVKESEDLKKEIEKLNLIIEEKDKEITLLKNKETEIFNLKRKISLLKNRNIIQRIFNIEKKLFKIPE